MKSITEDELKTVLRDVRRIVGHIPCHEVCACERRGRLDGPGVRHNLSGERYPPREWAAVTMALNALHYYYLYAGLGGAIEAARDRKPLRVITELAQRAPDVGALRDDLLAVARLVPRTERTEAALRKFPAYVKPNRPRVDLRDLEEDYIDWNWSLS